MDIKYNKKENVLAAVQQDGLALEYASDELKNNKEVVLAAIKNNMYALRDVSKELKIKIEVNEPIIVLEKLIQIKQEKINLENKIKNNSQVNTVKNKRKKI